MDDDMIRQSFDADDARRHVQAIIDQADTIVVPNGIEALMGAWHDHDRMVISFQLDHGSAVGSVVALLYPEDAHQLIHMLQEVLSRHNNTD